MELANSIHCFLKVAVTHFNDCYSVLHAARFGLYVTLGTVISLGGRYREGKRIAVYLSHLSFFTVKILNAHRRMQFQLYTGIQRVTQLLNILGIK